MLFDIEHFLFSHHSLSGQSPELQPLHLSFLEHKQQASPQRAIPNFLFISASFISKNNFLLNYNFILSNLVLKQYDYAGTNPALIATL